MSTLISKLEDCAHIQIVILVTHTMVIEDSDLTLIDFYATLLHWEVRFYFT